MPTEEHTISLDQVPVFYRSAPVAGPGLTPVYLHTALTSSDDWQPALEVTGGLAPDLIGFGRSSKGGHLDYTPRGIAAFVWMLVDELELERVDLVAHGWGAAVAAHLAAGVPQRVRRLVLVDPLPPLEETRWPRLVAAWRTPVVGELVMGALSKKMLGRWLGSGSSPWPEPRLDAAWEQFDQGTQRSTLRLHRWATPEHTVELSRELESVQAAPAILRGERDPWSTAEVADGWAQALGRAPSVPAGGRRPVETIKDAGHWPWRERPGVLGRIAQLLADP